MGVSALLRRWYCMGTHVGAQEVAAEFSYTKAPCLSRQGAFLLHLYLFLTSVLWLLSSDATGLRTIPPSW